MIMAFIEVVNNNNNASNVAMEFRIVSNEAIDNHDQRRLHKTKSCWNIKCKHQIQKLKMQTIKISFDLKENICKDIIV